MQLTACLVTVQYSHDLQGTVSSCTAWCRQMKLLALSSSTQQHNSIQLASRSSDDDVNLGRKQGRVLQELTQQSHIHNPNMNDDNFFVAENASST